MQFKSLGVAEREAVMKALNNDAQRLLTDSTDLSESKQAKLKDTLQKCNDQYMKLNRKLRERVSIIIVSYFVYALHLYLICNGGGGRYYSNNNNTCDDIARWMLQLT